MRWMMDRKKEQIGNITTQGYGVGEADFSTTVPGLAPHGKKREMKREHFKKEIKRDSA